MEVEEARLAIVKHMDRIKVLEGRLARLEDSEQHKRKAKHALQRIFNYIDDNSVINQLHLPLEVGHEVDTVATSVADPDPHDFGPPGSGSTSQRYGSGSGSFYYQA